MCINEQVVKMETKRKNGDLLKQALERRKDANLSSNFSFRMMEQIRLEAAQQQKRKNRILLWALIATVFLLVGGVAAYLVGVMNIRPSLAMIPTLRMPEVSFSVVGFYAYIAFLGFVMLGLDYWLRRKKRME